MRLLIVEDNAKLAGLMARQLGERGMAVDAVGGVEEARAALGVATYDAILLDLGLPDGDGREILRRLRAAGEGVRVLVVTARGALAERVDLLDSGADDYLVKPFSIEELLARVRALLRRPAQALAPVLSAGNVALDTRTLTLRIDGAVCEMPPRELRVLAALLSHHGTLLSRERLEQAVYSFDDEVTPNAIEAAISRLRRRLEQAGATLSVTAMRGLGYILAERAA